MKRPVGYYAIRIIPVSLFSIFIFTMSSMSDPPLPNVGFQMFDKVMHTGAYFVLGLTSILAATLRTNGKLAARSIAIGLAFALLFGVTDEIHQMYVPNRTPDVLDWCADAFGAASSVLFLYLLQKFLAIRREGNLPVQQ